MPLALQTCPVCRSGVPFTGASTTRLGVEVYSCPSCAARLRRKSEYRAIVGSISAVVVAGIAGFVPLWIGLPVVSAYLFWDVRWTFELERVADEVHT
jgi:hypothetical protein